MKLGLTQDHNICTIAIDDEEAVSALATALGLPPSEIRNLIVFAQQVLMNAEARDLSQQQLMCVVLHVLIRVLEQLPASDKSDVCFTVYNTLLSMSVRQPTGSADGIVLAATDQRIKH